MTLSDPALIGSLNVGLACPPASYLLYIFARRGKQSSEAISKRDIEHGQHLEQAQEVFRAPSVGYRSDCHTRRG